MERTVADPNIAILAGGVSSRMRQSVSRQNDLNPRLRSDAERKPKAMIGIGRHARPFLDYLLDNIARAGYRNVAIVIGDGGDVIRNYCENPRGGGQFPDLRFSFATQTISPGWEKPAGTADALLQALNTMQSWQHRKFTVCNSDNLYSEHVLRMILEDSHRNAMIDYDRSALRFDQERISQFAIVQRDSDGFLLDILEKPSSKNIAENRGRIGVSMNIFRFSYDDIYPVLNEIPFHPVRGEKELPNAVRMLVERIPHSVYAIPIAEHVPDLTSVADVLSVADHLDGGPDDRTSG